MLSCPSCTFSICAARPLSFSLLRESHIFQPVSPYACATSKQIKRKAIGYSTAGHTYSHNRSIPEESVPLFTCSGLYLFTNSNFYLMFSVLLPFGLWLKWKQSPSPCAQMCVLWACLINDSLYQYVKVKFFSVWDSKCLWCLYLFI